MDARYRVFIYLSIYFNAVAFNSLLLLFPVKMFIRLKCNRYVFMALLTVFSTPEHSKKKTTFLYFKCIASLCMSRISLPTKTWKKIHSMSCCVWRVFSCLQFVCVCLYRIKTPSDYTFINKPFTCRMLVCVYPYWHFNNTDN